MWDPVEKERSSILRPTKDGYPHIVFLRTSTQVDSEVLKRMSWHLMQKFVLERVSVDKAWIRVYTENARTCYDVVLGFRNDMERYIQKVRDSFSKHHGIPATTAYPYITHSTHWTLPEATAELDSVKQKIPCRSLLITGVAIA